MPGASRDHEGYLGDLTEKSTPELIELLKTKEKFLQKRNFLRSLPDRGRKVEEFVEMLQKMIIDRRRLGDGTVVVDEHIVVGNPDLNIDSNMSTKSSSKTKSQFAQLRDKHTVRDDKDMDIESQMRVMTVQDKTESESRFTGEDCVVKQLINTACPEKIYVVRDKVSAEEEGSFINSYQKAMMKSEQAEKHLKQRFRPNSSLKIATLEELPEIYRGTCKKDGNSKMDVVTTSENSAVIQSGDADVPLVAKFDPNDEESAVKPPKYKYDQIKVISLEKSFQLQQDQRIKYEELRAQQAAQRLASKLNIKMEPYSPEGGTDMAYRMKEELDEKIADDELDSDDNEEEYPD